MCQSESIPRTAAILDHAVLWHSLFLQAQRCSLDWRAKVTVLCDEDNAINEGPATSRKRAYQASSVVDKVNTQSKRRRTADTVGLEVEEEHLSTTEQHQGDRHVAPGVAFRLITYRSYVAVEGGLQPGAH